MGNPVPIAALAQPAAIQQAPSSAIRLYWQNPYGLTPDQINGAFQNASKLFSPYTFDVHQWNSSAPIPDGQYYRVVFGKGTTPSENGEVAGDASVKGRVVHVYPQALGEYNQQEYPAALEEVLAHEIGHVLGLPHAPGGWLMSPDVSPSTVNERLHPLDKRQLKRIGITLKTLAGGSP